jgi:Fur family ferric uptake transcriptional regulator
MTTSPRRSLIANHSLQGLDRFGPTRRWHDRLVTGEGDANLRRSGRRLTRQRRVIWDVLDADPDAHLSAEDIVERVRRRLPRVNTSTVYRTLEILVHDGLLLRTDLGGDRAYYELVREHRHHHVICERCGKVTHLHEETLGDLPARIEQDSGYRLSNRELSFFGRCPSCLRAES